MATDLSIQKLFKDNVATITREKGEEGEVIISIAGGGDIVAMDWDTWINVRKFIDDALDYVAEVKQ